MFYLLILFFNLMNSTLLTFIFHPLAMGLVLLLQTLLICLITGLSLKTFWFSYILFLIFLGGLLVLFIYVSSLASNEMFKFSKKIFLFYTFSLFMITATMFISDKMLFFMNFFTPDSLNMMKMSNFYAENSLMLNKLFNFPVNIFTILLMIYLFLTLIATVKITNIFEGPLRPKF